jgi:DNA-binding response OmpR family regulator
MKLRGKILIVDDEPINLEFFDVMLSKLGFQVEKAVDGEEALERVSACNPDLIILDNIMPKLSGWEVTRTLKHDPAYRKFRNTPIIMFSAMNEVKDRIEGFEQGVDDYITKPFNFSEVLARIRAVLRSRELSRQLLRREKRIAVVESLNNSLVFFTQHIKKPISELLALAEKTDGNNPSEARKLLELTRAEGREILATLRGLEDEVAELQGKGEKLKRGDLSLEDLESKLRKHLRNWKQRQEKLDGARGASGTRRQQSASGTRRQQSASGTRRQQSASGTRRTDRGAARPRAHKTVCPARGAGQRPARGGER